MPIPLKPDNAPVVGRQRPFVEKYFSLHPIQPMLEPDGAMIMRTQLRQPRGFTLIELMIVVVVAAILAAIAYPSYLNQVRKGRRADAHAMLQAAQLAEEKWRLNNTTYTATVANLTGVTATSEAGYYTLAISGNSGSAYTLTATAVGSQASDSSCPTITITLAAGVTTYGPSNTCWNK